MCGVCAFVAMAAPFLEKVQWKAFKHDTSVQEVYELMSTTMDFNQLRCQPALLKYTVGPVSEAYYTYERSYLAHAKAFFGARHIEAPFNQCRPEFWKCATVCAGDADTASLRSCS
eukprot:Skav235908  [mRNA]  locus=scaffold1747:2658:7129:- [translate_table: standard]